MRQNSYRLASLAYTLPSILGFARLTSCSAPPRLLLPPFNLSYPPCPLSPIPFLFKPLRTLLHSPKTQLLSFQAIPHSLAKTTGGGGTYANLTPSRFQIRSTTFRPFTVPRSIKTVVNHRKMQTASPNNDVASAVWG